MALTSVVMKSFEKLVLAHLKDITAPSLDTLQFAYSANSGRCSQHGTPLCSATSRQTRDFSLAFNTIIPNRLLAKITQLSVPTSACQWINSFLTDRQQLVRLGKFTSSTVAINTGAPQGCVLSPLFYSLYTKLLKFADDTTLIDLIQDSDESAYR